MNDTVEIPQPVGKAAALKALALSIVNVISLLADFGGQVVVALNLLVGAAIYCVDMFWLRSVVVPTKNLKERLTELEEAP